MPKRQDLNGFKCSKAGPGLIPVQFELTGPFGEPADRFGKIKMRGSHPLDNFLEDLLILSHLGVHCTCKFTQWFFLYIVLAMP